MPLPAPVTVADFSFRLNMLFFSLIQDPIIAQLPTHGRLSSSEFSRLIDRSTN
jgi:hypothetical protein